MLIIYDFDLNKKKHFLTCTALIFYILLTVHPGTTPGKWPTWCTITLYKTFIII